MTTDQKEILPDGRVRYPNGRIYTPVPEKDRKYGHNKPDHPGAILYSSRWFLPLDLADPKDRVMPETRPDTDAYDHMIKPRPCMCNVCKRPESWKWKWKWKRDNPNLKRKVKRPPRPQIRNDSPSTIT